MNEKQTQECANNILNLVFEYSPEGTAQFSILMTAVTIFLASQDELYDGVLDGLGDQLKRNVKIARKKLKELN